MPTKRVLEHAKLSVDPQTNTLRVCLIEEGPGSSADYPREFFTPENGQRMAGALSFPGHPVDLDHPEFRDPMSAIGSIGDTVTLEEHNGKLSFWSDYHPAKSKPKVGEYLAEYATKLGISVYSDSNGHDDGATGKWIAESFAEEDPYRSADLVVAAGARGKFERVAEGLRRVIEASATAGEKEETHMDKDIEARFEALDKSVKNLAESLEGKHKADLQVEVDTAAVARTVSERLSDYAKSEALIAKAKLTESQSESLRALALAGTTSEEIVPLIEKERTTIAEARALPSDDDDDDSRHIRVTEHLGSHKSTQGKGFQLNVPAGFGKVN